MKQGIKNTRSENKTRSYKAMAPLFTINLKETTLTFPGQCNYNAAYLIF